MITTSRLTGYSIAAISGYLVGETVFVNPLRTMGFVEQVVQGVATALITKATLERIPPTCQKRPIKHLEKATFLCTGGGIISAIIGKQLPYPTGPNSIITLSLLVLAAGLSAIGTSELTKLSQNKPERSALIHTFTLSAIHSCPLMRFGVLSGTVGLAILPKKNSGELLKKLAFSAIPFLGEIAYTRKIGWLNTAWAIAGMGIFGLITAAVTKEIQEFIEPPKRRKKKRFPISKSPRHQLERRLGEEAKQNFLKDKQGNSGQVGIFDRKGDVLARGST